MLSSSWGVASPVRGDGVEVPEDFECSRLKEKSSVFTRRDLRSSLHQFLNLALVATHDSLKVSRLKDDTTSDQNDVIATGQERDAVRDEDPGFGFEQTTRSDDMICVESVT